MRKTLFHRKLRDNVNVQLWIQIMRMLSQEQWQQWERRHTQQNDGDLSDSHDTSGHVQPLQFPANGSTISHDVPIVHQSSHFPVCWRYWDSFSYRETFKT